VSLRMFLLGLTAMFSVLVCSAHPNRGSVSVGFSPCDLNQVSLTVPVIIPLRVGMLLALLFPAVCDLRRTLFPHCDTYPPLFPTRCFDCGAKAL
jgi:hypothetical protein